MQKQKYNPNENYGKGNVPSHNGRKKNKKNTVTVTNVRGVPVPGVGGSKAGSHRRGR